MTWMSRAGAEVCAAFVATMSIACGPTVPVGDDNGGSGEESSSPGTGTTLDPSVGDATAPTSADAEVTGEPGCTAVLDCFGEPEVVAIAVVPRELLVGHIDDSALADVVVRSQLDEQGTGERITVIDLAAQLPAFTTAIDDPVGGGALGDVDGDGRDDLVVATGGTLAVFTGPPALVDPGWTLDGDVYLGQPFFLDRDGDGARELLIEHAAPGGFAVFELPAAAAPTAIEEVSFGSNDWGSFGSAGLVMAQLDGDALRDVVAHVPMYCDFGGTVALVAYPGAGEPWAALDVGGELFSPKLASGELDGIPGDEIVFTDNLSPIRQFTGGNAALLERAPIEIEDVDLLAVGDVSGDGRGDVVVVTAGVLHVLADFTGDVPGIDDTLKLPYDATALAIADFDGDDRLDLLLGTADATLVLMRGQG